MESVKKNERNCSSIVLLPEVAAVVQRADPESGQSLIVNRLDSETSANNGHFCELGIDWHIETFAQNQQFEPFPRLSVEQKYCG